MFEGFFSLSQRPFTPAPNAEAYITMGALENARQTLVRCLERAEGTGLVVGPAGTGKSLLCQLVAKHFRGRFQVALLSGARLSSRRALLQNILFELKLPYRDQDEAELRLSLIDHLEPRSGGPEGLLLLLDEAHLLPLRLIEEIRLLTNLVRQGQSRVRLLLAGSMALEEQLSNPKLESFQQRIAARCYLQPLARDETIYYIQEQLRRAGGNADSIFTADAQASIHAQTDGVPRLINQLCDHALLLAALGGQRQIDVAGIEEAWADLQQLPLPQRRPSPAQSDNETGATIEFGQLTEEPSAVAGTIGPSVEATAVATLDTITQRIDSLGGQGPAKAGDGTGAADDFSPVGDGATEVELIFHGAHDPFGGQWEEEEVVIDRYASLEDAVLRRSHSLTSDEGRKLGAEVNRALKRLEPGAAAGNNEQGTAAERGGGEPAADFEPASDPLLPEEPEASDLVRQATIPLRELPQDDRDIIRVQDEAIPPTAASAAQKRRPEYRQLFSMLRSK
jgi:type II secretory pathway predicted ATPase ExeA